MGATSLTVTEWSKKKKKALFSVGLYSLNRLLERSGHTMKIEHPLHPGAVLLGERPRAGFPVPRCPHMCTRPQGLSRVTLSDPREGRHYLFRELTALCTKGPLRGQVLLLSASSLPNLGIHECFFCPRIPENCMPTLRKGPVLWDFAFLTI